MRETTGVQSGPHEIRALLLGGREVPFVHAAPAVLRLRLPAHPYIRIKLMANIIDSILITLNIDTGDAIMDRLRASTMAMRSDVGLA